MAAQHALPVGRARRTGETCGVATTRAPADLMLSWASRRRLAQPHRHPVHDLGVMTLVLLAWSLRQLAAPGSSAEGWGAFCRSLRRAASSACPRSRAITRAGRRACCPARGAPFGASLAVYRLALRLQARTSAVARCAVWCASCGSRERIFRRLPGVISPAAPHTPAMRNAGGARVRPQAGRRHGFVERELLPCSRACSAPSRCCRRCKLGGAPPGRNTARASSPSGDRRGVAFWSANRKALRRHSTACRRIRGRDPRRGTFYGRNTGAGAWSTNLATLASTTAARAVLSASSSSRYLLLVRDGGIDVSPCRLLRRSDTASRSSCRAARGARGPFHDDGVIDLPAARPTRSQRRQLSDSTAGSRGSSVERRHGTPTAPIRAAWRPRCARLAIRAGATAGQDLPGERCRLVELETPERRRVPDRLQRTSS